MIVAGTSCICDSSFPQINLAIALSYPFHTHTELPSLWPVAGISSVFVSVYVFPSNITVAVYVLIPVSSHVASFVTVLVIVAETSSLCEVSFSHGNVAVALSYPSHAHEGVP